MPTASAAPTAPAYSGAALYLGWPVIVDAVPRFSVVGIRFSTASESRGTAMRKSPYRVLANQGSEAGW